HTLPRCLSCVPGAVWHTFDSFSLSLFSSSSLAFFFFFQAPSPTDIYSLSLHDALPISGRVVAAVSTSQVSQPLRMDPPRITPNIDRKSTRLNSSHVSISYAVFCLKKKKPGDALYLSRRTREWQQGDIHTRRPM